LNHELVADVASAVISAIESLRSHGAATVTGNDSCRRQLIERRDYYLDDSVSRLRRVLDAVFRETVWGLSDTTMRAVLFAKVVLGQQQDDAEQGAGRYTCQYVSLSCASYIADQSSGAGVRSSHTGHACCQTAASCRLPSLTRGLQWMIRQSMSQEEGQTAMGTFFQRLMGRDE